MILEEIGNGPQFPRRLYRECAGTEETGEGSQTQV